MRITRVGLGVALALGLGTAGCVMMPPDGGRGGPAAPASVAYRCEVCGRHETATSPPTCHDQKMQPADGAVEPEAR